jgi:hypothetical protein
MAARMMAVGKIHRSLAVESAGIHRTTTTAMGNLQTVTVGQKDCIVAIASTVEAYCSLVQMAYLLFVTMVQMQDLERSLGWGTQG